MAGCFCGASPMLGCTHLLAARAPAGLAAVTGSLVLVGLVLAVSESLIAVDMLLMQALCHQ